MSPAREVFALTMDPAVQVEGVNKQFGEIIALESLDLSVATGDTFFFLGPNGSGKTTLIRLLTGGLRPTRGRIRVLGVDPYRHPDRIATRLGVAFEDHYLASWATASAYLRFAARARDLEKSTVSEAAKVFGLETYWDRPMGTYSAGMQKRVVLAQAWMGRPSLLILDEPFTNLDPEGRHLLSDLLTQRTEAGLTTLVASHLAEVGITPTHLSVLLNGRLQALGRLDELADRYASGAMDLSVRDPAMAVQALLAAGVGPITAEGGHVVVRGDSDAFAKAVSALSSAGIPVEPGRVHYDLWAIYRAVLSGRQETPADEVRRAGSQDHGVSSP